MISLDNIVFIDCETTGVDAQADRIIELGMVCVVDGERKRWCKRFNPGMPIPPTATEVHGIADADVANEKPFSVYAHIVHRALAGKHLAGYNLWRLDLPVIDTHLRESGLKLDLTGVLVIDAAAIFFKREPRTLADAVRKYCGREHDGKHGAAADAEATMDVLAGELLVYEDLAAMSLQDLAEYARLAERRPADLAGKLTYDAENRLCYAFGKFKGVPVLDEPSYAEWMLRCDRPPFPGSTCELLEYELHKDDITVSETGKAGDVGMPF